MKIHSSTHVKQRGRKRKHPKQSSSEENSTTTPSIVNPLDYSHATESIAASALTSGAENRILKTNDPSCISNNNNENCNLEANRQGSDISQQFTPSAVLSQTLHSNTFSHHSYLGQPPHPPPPPSMYPSPPHQQYYLPPPSTTSLPTSETPLFHNQ